jgi:uncharacterized iron-regulated protein
MKKVTLFILLTGIIALPMMFGQITDAHYKIYSVKAGKEVTLQEIVAEMKQYDVLFYGEEHDDSVTHFLEMKLFELMFAEYGDNTALSLEMFDRDVQPVMDEYLQGGIREKHFNKDARVWSNYSDYKPMVEFAKLNQLDVICANAASRYTNLAGREGQKALMALPASSKKFMAPLPYDTASGAYYQKLVDLTNHDLGTTNDTTKKMPPAAMMGGFNLIMGQSLWDATMAYSIAEYVKAHKGNKVMQVNGRFHSDEKFAIVTQLKKYSPKTNCLVISAGPDVSFPNIDWAKFTYLGDFIIITDPNVPKTFE